MSLSRSPREFSDARILANYTTNLSVLMPSAYLRDRRDDKEVEEITNCERVQGLGEREEGGCK